MINTLVIVNLIKKETIESIFIGEEYDIIEKATEPICNMQELKKFFNQNNEKYNSNLSVTENLNFLKRKKKIEGYRFQNYKLGLNNTKIPLDKKYDIFIDEVDLFNHQ